MPTPSRGRATRSGHATRPGFTLTEALAAVVLVAIVVPVVMQAVSLAGAAGSKAARQAEALALAESKLDELVATGAWRDGRMQGDLLYTPSGQRRDPRSGAAPDPEDFRWEAEVHNWYDNAVRVLEVRVTWRQRGAERQVALSTLVRAQEGRR